MKIVINCCFGGFSLSDRARREYCLRKGIDSVNDWEIERNDPVLVAVVESLGENACSNHSKLKIVQIPDEVKWQIQDYDGKEWVSEVHRTWN